MTAGPATRPPPAGRKIALLSVLYFAQGLPFGFQASALPAYLRQAGVSLTAIGFLGLLAAPWLLKALWAPLVDRYGSPRFGRRRSWIVPAQAGLTASCAAAAFVPPGDEGLPLLLGLVFLMNLFAATQDIAVDGLAVDLLERHELGLGNTAQVVGYKAGMITGGGLLVYASAQVGWQGLFLAMAGLTGLVLGVSLAFREPPPRPGAGPAQAPSLAQVVGSLLTAVRTSGGAWLLVFVGTYKLGESMLDVMFKPFLVDAGFSPERVGLWVGTYGMVASILGSLLGGLLALRVSLWAALALTASLRVAPLIGEWALAVIAEPGPAGTLTGVPGGAVIVVTCAEHLFGGALTTALFAFMMSRVDPRIGATHYTLLASVEVLGKMPGAFAAGRLAEADALGYAGVFALGTGLSVAFLALLLPLRPKEPRA